MCVSGRNAQLLDLRKIGLSSVDATTGELSTPATTFIGIPGQTRPPQVSAYPSFLTPEENFISPRATADEQSTAIKGEDVENGWQGLVMSGYSYTPANKTLDNLSGGQCRLETADGDGREDKNDIELLENSALKLPDSDTNDACSVWANLPIDSAPHHKLNSVWCLWYTKKERNLTLKAAENYESCIKLIDSFDTVEKFWALYSRCLRPSDMPVSCDYHLFRLGIKPMWEDPQNKEGGKWSVRIRKKFANIVWEEFILGLIGENLGTIPNDVCGAVLAIRYQEDIISLWNRSSNLEFKTSYLDGLRRVLHLTDESPLEYKEHDASLKNQQVYRPPQMRGLNDTLSSVANSQQQYISQTGVITTGDHPTTGGAGRGGFGFRNPKPRGHVSQITASAGRAERFSGPRDGSADATGSDTGHQSDVYGRPLKGNSTDWPATSRKYANKGGALGRLVPLPAVSERAGVGVRGQPLKTGTDNIVDWTNDSGSHAAGKGGIRTKFKEVVSQGKGSAVGEFAQELSVSTNRTNVSNSSHVVGPLRSALMSEGKSVTGNASEGD